MAPVQMEFVVVTQTLEEWTAPKKSLSIAMLPNGPMDKPQKLLQ
jgi:hypothetical protein